MPRPLQFVSLMPCCSICRFGFLESLKIFLEYLNPVSKAKPTTLSLDEPHFSCFQTQN